MKALLDFLNTHGTKIIGYLAVVLGYLATADQVLVTELLGEKFSRWALLIFGILTAARGHQNTAREKAAEKAATQGGFARLAVMLILAVGSIATVGLTSGCAALGLQRPETFNERAAVAISSVTVVRQTATRLLLSGKLTAADGRNIQAQADNARAAIEIAISIQATDPAAAENRLTAILAGLNAITAYLTAKGS
jgi:hypothetical protein